MKRERGFTLVELLAVIVILAIILIITVPGVLSIIHQTKEDALGSQKKMIEEAARLYIAGETGVTWVGSDPVTTTLSLDMIKSKGYLDQKIVNPKTNDEITCAKVLVTKEKKKNSYSVELCDQVNASPRLSSNMIPIVYDTAQAKWLKADDTNQGNSWYDYENQQWANVATVTETTRDAYQKANIGTEVKMEDINTMFVWIPRFKYKLWNVDGATLLEGNPNLAGEKMIDIQLEEAKTPKSDGTENGEWLTHPAFTFGGEELEGFWVGKFETGYKGATTTAEAEQNVVDASRLQIKPSIYSWRGLDVSHMYENAIGMGQVGNVFGLTTIEDPHLIKNMEWGALVYLTQSKYGKTGNVNATESFVRYNNNNLYLTGCGADSQEMADAATCNTYETVPGQAASTTGNITGVYDLSGGAWDYVAAVMQLENGTDLDIARSGFQQETLNAIGAKGKYLDVYDYGTGTDGRQRGHLGDATKEMGPFFNGTEAWDHGYSTLPLADDQKGWLERGGPAIEKPAIGINSYICVDAAASRWRASRIVIC